MLISRRAWRRVGCHGHVNGQVGRAQHPDTANRHVAGPEHQPSPGHRRSWCWPWRWSTYAAELAGSAAGFMLAIWRGGRRDTCRCSNLRGKERGILTVGVVHDHRGRLAAGALRRYDGEGALGVGAGGPPSRPGWLECRRSRTVLSEPKPAPADRHGAVGIGRDRSDLRRSLLHQVDAVGQDVDIRFRN